jgi:ferredoxin
MTWVIGPLCTDRMDTACVEVCPVNCIHRYLGDDPDIPKNQLLVDPEVCIDCGVCEPACPWETIYQDTAVPEEFQQYIEINARIAGQQAIESPDEDKPQPTAESGAWASTSSTCAPGIRTPCRSCSATAGRGRSSNSRR